MTIPPPDTTPDYCGFFPDKPRHAFAFGKLARLLAVTALVLLASLFVG